MKRDKEKMIRDDKQDFHFVGFQEENADTIPSEILVNLLYTWTEPLQDIHQQDIIFEKKTDILLTNDSLAPKQ